jgi:hypothetical protein
MKKLTFGIGVILAFVLMAASYKTNYKKLSRAADPAATINESLNGILQADADTMVKIAQDSAESIPPNTQIWFSKQILDSLYKLLSLDSLGAHNPDGIRIYFSSAVATRATPIQYGIVVTSTYFSGIDSSNLPNKTIIHTDYFTHTKTAGLFQLPNVTGVVSHYNDATDGDSLYTNCGCPLHDSCLASSDHYITKSTATEMVHAFIGKPLNAKCEWFDIKLLGSLVKEMDDKNENGIRLYFSRGTVNTVAIQDVGKARFVIVTTKIGNSSTGIDYFGCDRSLSASVKKRFKVEGGNNNGELCPDNCDGVTVP